MIELLKSNWFVVVIAIVILSFVTYFIFDMNNMPYSEFVKWSSEHKKYRKTRRNTKRN